MNDPPNPWQEWGFSEIYTQVLAVLAGLAGEYDGYRMDWGCHDGTGNRLPKFEVDVLVAVAKKTMPPGEARNEVSFPSWISWRMVIRVINRFA